jgi:sugar diacid utilization regulator
LKKRVLDVCSAVGSELVAGISSPRETPERYPDGYAEARQIVECIQRFGTPDGQRVFTAPELGLGRVFLAHADPVEVTTFAQSAFGELVRDESKHELLATLNCFFENMASVRRCASQLAVHENTIRYRLARVEELTGLAITHDPDAQLAARLSLLVLALSGALDTHDLSEHNEREAAARLKVVGTVS